MRSIYDNTRNLSARELRIEEQLEGWHAAARGKPLDLSASYDWRLGWQANKDGRILSTRILQAIMR